MAHARNHQELVKGAFPPALLLVAFALRVIRLDFQPLWWDEGYSLYVATMSLPAMLARTAEDIHPPFYYALLHLWIGLCGARPVAVRMFSVAGGLLGLALLYTVGRRLLGRKVALLALFIAAFSPFHVYYSQEVRMYGLMMALGLLSVYLMWRWLEESRSIAPYLAGYMLFTAAALYTHYYAIFILICQSIFVLYEIYCKGRKGRILHWLAGQVAIFIFYLPWVIYTASKLSAYVQGKVEIEKYSPLPLHLYLARHLIAFSVGHISAGISPLGWATLLFAGLAVVGMAKREMAKTSFLALYLLGPIFLGYLVNLRFPFAPARVERLLLLVAPAWYLLVALGMRRLFLVPILLISGISLYDFYTVPRYPEDDYRPLIAQIGAWARPEDAVLCLYPWQIGYFHSYLPGLALTLYPAFEIDWEARHKEESLLSSYLDGLMARHERLWFPAHQSAGRLLETEIESYLSAHYYPVLGDWLNPHTRLFFYTAGGKRRAAGPEQVNFAGKVYLVRSELDPGPLEAGRDVVEVNLVWRKAGYLEGIYRVGLRLADEVGNTWAQRDGEPLAGLRPFSFWEVGEEVQDRHGLFLPAGTPPGRYELRLKVYRTDGQMLDVLDANLIPQGVEVVLGNVEVIFPASPPPLEALPIQHHLTAELSDGEISLRFLGWSLPEGPFLPGEEIQLSLFWQTWQKIKKDYVSFVQLQEENGQILAAEERPVPHWEGGQFVREIHHLLLPASAPSGRYCLICGIYRSGDKARFKMKDGRDYIPLNPLEISAGRKPDYQKPSIPHPLYARFGEGVALLGYELSANQARPGEDLRLRLYWQALAPMDKSYTIFVHLLDKDEHIQGQIDTIPGRGTLPTTAWLPGEYLKDEYSFTVKEGARPGPHRLEIGLYEARTGARLPVLDENGKPLGDRLLLDSSVEILGAKPFTK